MSGALAGFLPGLEIFWVVGTECGAVYFFEQNHCQAQAPKNKTSQNGGPVLRLTSRLIVIKSEKQIAPGGVLEFFQRLGFYLTDSLSGNGKIITNLFQSQVD